MNFVSLNTIINDLLLTIRGSIISKSEPISRRQVENWVHQYRSLLLKQDLDKGKYPNPDYIQEVPFLELEVVPVEGTNLATGYVGYTSQQNVLRTKLTVPKPIDFNFKSGLTYIGKPDNTEIQLIPEDRSKLQQYKKYTSSAPLVYLKNNYLHVVGNTTGITHLTIRGIFEMPSDVARFVNPATKEPFFNLDSPYPIPANMLPVLKDMILSKELQINASAPSDTKNDSSHGLAQNVER